MKNFMECNGNGSFVIKVLLMGLLVAALVYFLYPAESHFTMVVNGEPVVDLFAQLATLPVLLAVAIFTGILFILAFLGAGLFVFLAAFLFLLFGIFMIVPYIWPLLLVVFIIVLIMLFGEKDTN